MADFDGNNVEDATPVVVSPAGTQFNKNFCKYCGKELQPGAAFCSSCGKPQGNVSVQQPPSQTIQQPVVQPQVAYVYQQPQPTVAPNVSNTTTVIVEGSHSNSIGIAGFVFALLGLIFCWVPGIDLILWFLGLVFSIIGLFKTPRGMAIAGFILSFVVIIAIIVVLGSFAAAFQKM